MILTLCHIYYFLINNFDFTSHIYDLEKHISLVSCVAEKGFYTNQTEVHF